MGWRLVIINMNRNYHKLRLLIVFFLLTTSFIMHAQDFGVLVDQSVDFNMNGLNVDNWQFNYSGSIIPYFSSLIGGNSELIIAAAFSYCVEPWFYIPELLLTELTMRLNRSEIKLGRMEYEDPLGMIASGYFDGALFSFDTNGGTFSIGGLYTGYLFKTRAAITMTKDEEKYSHEMYSFDDFQNTYFAPARLLSSLNWKHPSIGGFLDVKFSLLGQFDFTGANLDSQYAVLNLSIPSTYFILDFGGCFELIQYNGIQNGMDDITMAVAAKAGLTLIIPDRHQKRISLQGIYASGVFEDVPIGAFLPVTTIPHGNLLNAKLAGLSIVSFNFITNYSDTVLSDLSVSFFMRNDLGTYNNYPVMGTDSKGFYLGPEFYYRFSLNSASGFHMNLGGGVFIPFLGDAMPDADILWRAEASILFSLF